MTERRPHSPLNDLNVWPDKCIHVLLECTIFSLLFAERRSGGSGKKERDRMSSTRQTLFSDSPFDAADKTEGEDFVTMARDQNTSLECRLRDRRSLSLPHELAITFPSSAFLSLLEMWTLTTSITN